MYDCISLSSLEKTDGEPVIGFFTAVNIGKDVVNIQMITIALSASKSYIDKALDDDGIIDKMSDEDGIIDKRIL
jgi:hypothetical protein